MSIGCIDYCPVDPWKIKSYSIIVLLNLYGLIESNYGEFNQFKS